MSDCIVKICGIRDPDTAAEAVKLGADWVGLIMYDKSKRYIDNWLAKMISSSIKNEGGLPVAVFVDHEAQEMRDICKALEVNMVQLHGPVSRQQHHHLPRYIQRIYVLHINQSGEICDDTDKGIPFLVPERDYLLYDNIKGGSGLTFPWNNFIHHYPFRFILSGGLTPGNVNIAIKKINPNGVDVSSGVENPKYTKNIQLIEDFITNVKEERENYG